MLKQRRVPMRMCVGCREMKPKKELLRVVKSPEGAIAFDAECLARAVKTHALERQLECSVSEEVFSQLSAQLAGEDA